MKGGCWRHEDSARLELPAVHRASRRSTETRPVPAHRRRILAGVRVPPEHTRCDRHLQPVRRLRGPQGPREPQTDAPRELSRAGRRLHPERELRRSREQLRHQHPLRRAGHSAAAPPAAGPGAGPGAGSDRGAQGVLHQGGCGRGRPGAVALLGKPALVRSSAAYLRQQVCVRLQAGGGCSAGAAAEPGAAAVRRAGTVPHHAAVCVRSLPAGGAA